MMWLLTTAHILQIVQIRLCYFILDTITVIILLLLSQTPLLTQASSKSEQSYPTSGWNLTLDDPLNKENGSWDMNASCQFTSGVYQASAEADKVAACLNKSTDLSNFAFEANVKRVKGKGELIGFLMNTKLDGYIFSLGENGKYAVSLLERGKKRTELASGTSSAIHTDLNLPNLLAVVAQGNIFYLYANKQFIRTVTDQKNTFNSGTIGLGVDASDKPSEASFSNVKVWVPLASKPS